MPHDESGFVITGGGINVILNDSVYLKTHLELNANGRIEQLAGDKMLNIIFD